MHPRDYSALDGKTVARCEYDYDDGLRVFFVDGSMLYVEGVWHNDSTAGTAVSLLAPQDPKSYGESKEFHAIAKAKEWE